MNARQLILSLALPLALVACEDENTTIVQSGGPVADPTVFQFRTDAEPAFAKVDRMGGPATTTALLMPGGAGGARRQQANLTEPADDTQYAGEYVATLRVLHFELAPVLTQLTLAPCGVAGTSPDTTNVDKCVAQAAPVVIPDVLRLDTSQPSGYPNGRDLDDQVVDILLAVGLLDLTDPAARCLGGPCTARTLADLPLNPPASNPPPLAQFPFANNVMLAPPPPADP